MWTNLASSKLEEGQGTIEIPARSASPYLAKGTRSFAKSNCATASRHGSSRYLLQKARVPREVCASTVLVDRLTGFMLRPLSHTKACKERCEHLRHEIEGRQKIEKHTGLWHGDHLSYVAETKAKTIQLRNRTLRLLAKTDSYERLPERVRRVSIAPKEFAQTFQADEEDEEEEEGEEGAEEDDDEEETCKNQESSEYYESGNASVYHSAACDDVVPSPPEEPLPIASTPKRRQSKRRATLCIELDAVEVVKKLSEEDASTGTNERLTPTTPPAHPRSTRSFTPSRGSSPEGPERDSLSQLDSRPSSASSPRTRLRSKDKTSKQGQDIEASVSRPSSRSGVSTPTRENSKRPALLKCFSRKNRESLKNRLLRRALTKDDPLKHTAKGLTSFMEKHFLFEEKRMIVTLQDGKTDPSGHIACSIRISENREHAGSMLLEVSLNQKGWMRGDIVERVIRSDEIQKLFTWGNKQSDAAEARYKWLGDLIVLRALEEPMQSETASTKGHNSGFGIIFNGYDNVDETERYHPGIEQFRTEVRNLFGHTKEACNAEVEFTNFSLRIGFSDKRQSVREARAELEIESARMRFDLYENTSRALHNWYTRLDVTGDGQIDEEEFGFFMQGLINTLCKGVWDALPAKRHWHDLRAFNGTIGFTQFVSYLIGKFPHVQHMTGFDVKRFEEKAKRAPAHQIP